MHDLSTLNSVIYAVWIIMFRSPG